MGYQYIVVNQCLQLLKQSNLPTIKKLLVEIQLIQMKRLLLDDTVFSSSTQKSWSCGEGVFDGLLSQMRRTCGGNNQAESLADLMERMSGMLTVLSHQEGL